MQNTPSVNNIMQYALGMAAEMRHEYLTPEHLLCALLQQQNFGIALHNVGADLREVGQKAYDWVSRQEKLPTGQGAPEPSSQFTEVVQTAVSISLEEDKETVGISEYAEAILQLQDSQAAYLLGSAIEGQEEHFIYMLQRLYESEEPNEFDDDPGPEEESDDWKKLVTDISEQAETHTPLIGREKEMERTIEVLCRMEKNNPLHIGEPGVGKTALVYGLADLINKRQVPERLLECKIYGMDVGQMLAGTQYRGDFEKRLKQVLDGAQKEHAILYLDEIHNIIGAGRGSDGGPDASNILKPYLESGSIRFIGATTYEEFNRHMAKDRGIVRRFQPIDILEPTIEETIKIIKGLQPTLQKFHNVVYHKDAIDYAVRASAKHISDRRLPDKAIDLIDEAGAYLEVHPQYLRQKPYVTKSLINDILIKVCKIEASALKEEGNAALATIKDDILSQIYGQDRAVEEVTNAVMMAKAGLTDDDKPLASLLFVGPTGVGKTEVARVLAQKLGVELVRFDMSEYTEKHAVAKLIGSPAGYVGYEDGGQLTAAIRKTPNCVLLLDEIEKAHADIYNILLQVMDYARLTDNRGQKADFRNVILIMTSNAGAQYASQASIGFTGGVPRGEAMLKQVKKTFKPEFMNRLTATVVFNDMDRHMAELILKKKLGLLSQKMETRKVELKVSPAAFDRLLSLGYTREYGAREMDRIISAHVKPLLMREILFGKLRKGGRAKLEYSQNAFRLA